MNYEELLKRAEDKISREVTTESRFKIPEANILVQGNNTLVSNFSEIANGLGRDPKHVLKFLLQQLAAPGSFDGTRVNFLGKFTKNQIDNKIKLYAKDYVFCHICGKPDTELIVDGDIVKMKCEACGSKRFIKKV